MTVSGQSFSLKESLSNIEVISEHVLLCSQTENRLEFACGRYRAESVVVIAATVFAFLAQVLPLHNQAYFALVKFPPCSLNLVMETDCEDTILRSKQ